MTPRINSIDKVVGTVSYEELAVAVSQSEPLTKAPKTLRLQDIDVAERGVFQWRYANENVFQSEANTLGMVSALKDPGKPLEPILVFPAGGKFYVMDGHHRLDAYRTVKWKRPIPVEVFRGTLEEAHKEALKRNSRNKLSMTKREKSEAAWALVKEDRCSKSEITELATVGLRTVGNSWIGIECSKSSMTSGFIRKRMGNGSFSSAKIGAVSSKASLVTSSTPHHRESFTR